MKKIYIFLILIFITNCSLNKAVQHHGVHNLDKKQKALKINISNKNDILKIIGPPSTKSTFNNEVYIYIERKTSTSKLTKLGKKVLLVNNVLILDIDKKGLLIKKEFFNKEDMKNIKYSEMKTENPVSKQSFVTSFLQSVRQKMYGKRKF